MKIWEDKNEQIPDNTLQKLLWIGDYFQVDKFQATIIQEVLIPRIRIENCLQFLNEANHPSISWKLANISSIVNKETNPFKFNDYQWKLAAKMEEAINNDQKDEIQQKKQKTLRIYLKLEKQSKDSKQLLPDENSDEPSKIIAIYFLLKINDHNSKSTLQVKHIIVDRSPQILMCQFHEKEFGYYENKKLEFTVFLNTDYIYSLLLNYFQRNWLQYYHSAKLGQMNLDDLEVIIKATPQNEKAQSEVIKLALEYRKYLA
ncbi:hypothetical protein PPERSA_11813 [Pseudocohnilembus persalinus]|uniref:Uncharacterized protein n=1 Tax=Pseudocohnilembus persalinus TaxID=266149 RepID=A0A0V0QS40_PSEPJ|nr:hypothetical protein PPERSA_11813 [Pseudocohnilembus persalinus]|eukprot:KRX04757.1 hypothetical protein PPERSA_11813 [Pseudocohnilembus persalinus]